MQLLLLQTVVRGGGPSLHTEIQWTSIEIQHESGIEQSLPNLYPQSLLRLVGAEDA